ncbi:MAG: ribosomal-processing cysteine protease Prp [Clostridium sp.]
MTEITFRRLNKKIVSFNIDGHSGYGEEGSDIICAAISAISLTIVNGIQVIQKMRIKPTVKDGFLSLDITNLSDKEINDCQILMETMLLGFKSVEIEYDEYVIVKEEEV